MLVTLREITAQTVRQITSLAVAPEQECYVASNAVSLAEALFYPEAWYRAIYFDESPAGFVMLYDESLRSTPPPKPEIAIWRFMIDSQFQRRSIGAEALALVIDHVRSNPVFSDLIVSYVPGPGCAERLYLRAGFRHTDRIEHDEVVLTLPLTAPPQAAPPGDDSGDFQR